MIQQGAGAPLGAPVTVGDPRWGGPLPDGLLLVDGSRDVDQSMRQQVQGGQELVYPGLDLVDVIKCHRRCHL